LGFLQVPKQTRFVGSQEGTCLGPVDISRSFKYNQ
jgi:hypothetical protein